MSGRREHIVRGAKLVALAPKLKTRQIKKIERKCRARVNQLAALTSASGGIPATSYAFNSDGGRYRIDYAGPGQPWTLEVVRAPPKKAVRKRPATKEANAKQALAKKTAARKAVPKTARKRSKSAPAAEAAHPRQRRVTAPGETAPRAPRGTPGAPPAKRSTSPGPMPDPPDKP